MPIEKKTDIDKILNDYKKKSKFAKIDGVISVTEARKNPYFNLLEKIIKSFLKFQKTKKILFEDRMHRKYMSMLLVCMF